MTESLIPEQIQEPVSVDDNATTLSVDDGAGSLTVDGTVTVTEPVSVDDNAGSLTVDNSTLAVVGGGTEAAAMRVTIATDSTGVVSVDDNGSTLSVDDGAGSLTVDNAQLSVVGGGTEAAAMRVTLANDSTGLLSVDDNAGSLTVDNATISVVGGGTEATAQRVTIANDSTGVLSVDDNGAALTVDFSSIATGGCEFFKTIDLDETEEEVSATAATVYGMWVTNTATATRFIKFYNATAANVTVGTTAPDITIGIPGNATDDVAGVFTVPFPGGMAFSTALCLAATNLVADADATAPGANDIVLTLFFRN